MTPHCHHTNLARNCAAIVLFVRSAVHRLTLIVEKGAEVGGGGEGGGAGAQKRQMRGGEHEGGELQVRSADGADIVESTRTA